MYLLLYVVCILFSSHLYVKKKVFYLKVDYKLMQIEMSHYGKIGFAERGPTSSTSSFKIWTVQRI